MKITRTNELTNGPPIIKFCCDAMFNNLAGYPRNYHIQGSEICTQNSKKNISFCPFCGEKIDIEYL